MQAIRDMVVLVFLALAVAAAMLVLVVGMARGGPADSAIRLPSHGMTGAVVATGRGWTRGVTSAHGFKGGKALRRRIIIDAPARRSGAVSTAAPRLVAVDYRRDLALVEWSAGPAPYVARLAAQDPVPGDLLYSVGYDRMRSRYLVWYATCAYPQFHWRLGWIQRTVEPPDHGRSGGPLFDSEGHLVGLVIGYDPGGGMYVHRRTIQAFLRGE